MKKCRVLKKEYARAIRAYEERAKALEPRFRDNVTMHQRAVESLKHDIDELRRYLWPKGALEKHRLIAHRFIIDKNLAACSPILPQKLPRLRCILEPFEHPEGCRYGEFETYDIRMYMEAPDGKITREQYAYLSERFREMFHHLYDPINKEKTNG